jgi:hypothetical protein
MLIKLTIMALVLPAALLVAKAMAIFMGVVGFRTITGIICPHREITLIGIQTHILLKPEQETKVFVEKVMVLTGITVHTIDGLHGVGAAGMDTAWMVEIQTIGIGLAVAMRVIHTE